jgi:hypothetical protein
MLFPQSHITCKFLFFCWFIDIYYSYCYNILLVKLPGFKSGPNQSCFALSAEEAPSRQIKILNPGGGDDITAVKKPKRVLLKLDLEKLFSDRGLSAIPNHIKPLKFKGKGHELEDITNICKAYEHWAHRLYPKMTFKDVIEKVNFL